MSTIDRSGGADGMRLLSSTVAASECGMAVEDFLVARFPTYGRDEVLSAIGSGALTVDGASVSPDTPLREGAKIEFTVACGHEPDVDADFSIVLDEVDFAVIDKSGNLPCHPAGRYRENTLSRMLVAHHGFPEAHMVNRIDRETSGLVLVAKSAAAASRLGSAMMRGDFSKTYLVLAEGAWEHGEDWSEMCGVIRLARGRTVFKKRVFSPGATDVSGGGQIAVTRFRKVGFHDGISLLEAELETGRPHQIRATLKAIGHPVVGDKLYGVDETIYARMCSDAMTAVDIAALRMPRQALHSWRLRFRNPFSGAEVALEAPPPSSEPLWAETMRGNR